MIIQVTIQLVANGYEENIALISDIRYIISVTE